MPPQIRFKLIDVPAGDASMVIRTGATSVTGDQGVEFQLSRYWFKVAYGGPDGWEQEFVNVPAAPDGWDNSSWRIDHVGNRFTVSVNNVVLFAAANVPPREGPWVTFKKDGQDSEPSWLLKDLEIRHQAAHKANRVRNPACAFNADYWGGWGGSGSRTLDAGIDGGYGYRFVFDGGGGDAGVTFDPMPAGAFVAGSVWVRTSDARPLKLTAKIIAAGWTHDIQEEIRTFTTQAGVWQLVALPTGLQPVAGSIVSVKVSDTGSDYWGWNSGEVLDMTECEVRVW